VEGEKFNLSLLTQKGFYRGKTWKLWNWIIQYLNLTSQMRIANSFTA
jgi:hypothetical protein